MITLDNITINAFLLFDVIIKDINPQHIIHIILLSNDEKSNWTIIYDKINNTILINDAIEIGITEHSNKFFFNLVIYGIYPYKIDYIHPIKKWQQIIIWIVWNRCLKHERYGKDIIENNNF